MKRGSIILSITGIKLLILSFSFCESSSEVGKLKIQSEDSTSVVFEGNECKHELREPAITRLKTYS
jgi:hypothetical protein